MNVCKFFLVLSLTASAINCTSGAESSAGLTSADVAKLRMVTTADMSPDGRWIAVRLSVPRIARALSSCLPRRCWRGLEPMLRPQFRRRQDVGPHRQRLGEFDEGRSQLLADDPRVPRELRVVFLQRVDAALY